MNSEHEHQGLDEDTRARLEKIRRTIRESRMLIDQVELRIKETDRFLESIGLTRKQVSAMTFTDAQREAVNAELRRRGMEPIIEENFDHQDRQEHRTSAEPVQEDSGDDVENRRRKFGMMMNEYKL